VDLGDYEVVYPWPKPLPDDDLSHDGWTWGSGSGVWAESADKVWVGQRGEIELPPGAPPWIYASLLDPPRTNTGRRPYAGENREYDIRRHHIIFAVDRRATRSRSGSSTMPTSRRAGARDSGKSLAARTSS
jgi:hypothetical protein